MELWIKVHKNQVSCVQAVEKLAYDIAKLRSENYELIWVAMPAAYDWQWLNYYWNYAVKYGANTHEQKLGFKAECLSTAWKTFTQFNGKSNTENSKLWDDAYGTNTNKHNAYYDALHQGQVYIALLKYINSK